MSLVSILLLLPWYLYSMNSSSYHHINHTLHFCFCTSMPIIVQLGVIWTLIINSIKHFYNQQSLQVLIFYHNYAWGQHGGNTETLCTISVISCKSIISWNKSFFKKPPIRSGTNSNNTFPVKHGRRHRSPPHPLFLGQLGRNLGRPLQNRQRNSFLYCSIGFFSLFLKLWIIRIHLYC